VPESATSIFTSAGSRRSELHFDVVSSPPSTLPSRARSSAPPSAEPHAGRTNGREEAVTSEKRTSEILRTLGLYGLTDRRARPDS
jgi:hypothetical protein